MAALECVEGIVWIIFEHIYSIYILVCVKLKVPNTINLEFIDIKCDKKRTNMVALECVVGNGLIISEHVHRYTCV